MELVIPSELGHGAVSSLSLLGVGKDDSGGGKYSLGILGGKGQLDYLPFSFPQPTSTNIIISARLRVSILFILLISFFLGVDSRP